MDDMNRFRYGPENLNNFESKKNKTGQNQENNKRNGIIIVIFLVLFFIAISGKGNVNGRISLPGDGMVINLPPDMGFNAFLLCLFLFMAIMLATIFVFIGLMVKKHSNKTALAEKRALDPIRYDFDNGKRLFDGNLVVGKKYIFGRGNERVYSIDDVRALGRIDASISQGAFNTLSNRDMYLAAVLSNGETERICTINSTGNIEEEEDQWSSLTLCIAGKMLKKECKPICIDNNIFETEEQLKNYSDQFQNKFRSSLS